ncbi:MAG TPA: glycosyltransferase [Gemmataceae bacterium]|nr:glycosyltransferase [Gemmataceae bacterium]
MPVRPAMSADSSVVSANEAMLRWAAVTDRPSILLVARWPIGAVRAHLLANYSALCAAGFRFTFVGPGGETLERLRAGFDGIEGLAFVAAPVEERRCRLWPTVRALLREGRFGLLHSHGITAAVHAALANLGIAVPHLVTLHKPLCPNQFPGWMGCMKRWMLKRALHQADAIVTANEGARANLLENVPSLRDSADQLFTMADDIKAERLTALLQSLATRTPLTLSSEPIAA